MAGATVDVDEESSDYAPFYIERMFAVKLQQVYASRFHGMGDVLEVHTALAERALSKLAANQHLAYLIA